MLDRKDAAVFRAMCRYAVDNETDSISIPEFATQQKTGSNIDDPIEMIAHARLLEDFRPGVSASISGSGLSMERPLLA